MHGYAPITIHGPVHPVTESATTRPKLTLKTGSYAPWTTGLDIRYDKYEYGRNEQTTI